MIVFFLTITYPQQQPTESFYEFGQQPYNLIGTKKSVYIKKELSNKPIKTIYWRYIHEAAAKRSAET